MGKKAIKVVKRNEAAEKKQVFVNRAKVESITRRRIEGVVNNWINERREKSAAKIDAIKNEKAKV